MNTSIKQLDMRKTKTNLFIYLFIHLFIYDQSFLSATYTKSQRPVANLTVK